MRWLYLLIFLLLCIPGFCWGAMNPYIAGSLDQCSYVLQDLTTYTEYDPDSEIVVTSDTVTFTNVVNDADVPLVYKDFGAGYFDHDFTTKFDSIITSSGLWGIVLFWGLGETSSSAGADQLHNEVIAYYYNNNNAPVFRVKISEGSASLYGDNISVALNTRYYLTVIWLASGGVNGTGRASLEIRTGSHTGTLIGTSTVDSSVGEQTNYRYFFPLDGYVNNNTNFTSGDIKNYELRDCP